ncbi:MAG: DinB family protein [Deltaproteobacteria bacterium]|nr:DinB family protein [Deltaproteobacteria bacterium]
MTPDTARALARYNRWMNDKLYASALLLTDEERKRDRGAFFGSIHNVLNHILLADRIWLGRIAGYVPEPGFVAEGIKSHSQLLAESFDELTQERRKTDDAIDRWVESLSAESLAGTVRILRKGESHEYPLWWVVTHLFNHQTHHRGQATTLLFQAGHDPGVTDLFVMLNDERLRAG